MEYDHLYLRDYWSRYPTGKKVYYYCENGYYLNPAPPYSNSSMYPTSECHDGRWVGDKFHCG